jgi:hypothetical protein
MIQVEGIEYGRKKFGITLLGGPGQHLGEEGIKKDWAFFVDGFDQSR